MNREALTTLTDRQIRDRLWYAEQAIEEAHGLLGNHTMTVEHRVAQVRALLTDHLHRP